MSNHGKSKLYWSKYNAIFWLQLVFMQGCRLELFDKGTEYWKKNLSVVLKIGAAGKSSTLYNFVDIYAYFFSIF